MNYILFTLIDSINTLANVVFIIYILAFSFQSNIWHLYLKDYWCIALIALVIILFIPEIDLLRTMCNLPPEPIK